MWWLAAAGIATSAYGKYQTGKAAAASAEAQSELDFLKADEIIRRNVENRELMWESTEKLIGEQTVGEAGSGFAADVSSFARIEETLRAASDQAMRDAETAQWDASMAIATGRARLESGADAETAGLIGALGGAALSTYTAQRSAPSELGGS